MRLIDKHRPATYKNIVGNKKAINRIDRAVDDNDGFGGLVIMLLGKTGRDIGTSYVPGASLARWTLLRRSWIVILPL